MNPIHIAYKVLDILALDKIPHQKFHRAINIKSRNYYQSIIKGQLKDPSFRKIYDTARYLHVSIEFLSNGVDLKDDNIVKERALFAKKNPLK